MVRSADPTEIVNLAVDPVLGSTEFQRILLIKPSALGDVIHTLPVLAKLRKRYPAARIDWLLTPGIAELIGRHPAISNVLLFDRQGFNRLSKAPAAALGVTRLVNDLHKAQYDLVIDLHGQLRSAFFTLSTGAGVRIGFDRPRSGNRGNARNIPEETYRHCWTGAREGAWMAYTHRIRLSTLEEHAVDRYLRIAPMLGLDDGPAEFHVPLPEGAEEEAREILARHDLLNRPLAMLFPGTIWETKHWRVEGYAEVARYLMKSGRGVILAGSSKERARCRAVADGAPGAVDLSGQTSVTQLAALIRLSQICVTNDSGPMHLAVALDRPVVSVFGPTDPVWIGPYRRPEAVVRALGLACAPCYLRVLSKCAHEHACMNRVTGADVIERIERLIAKFRT
jgi:heptosyltransferase-1